MEEKEKDLDAGVATPGQSEMHPREQSPTGSASTEVDYDKITVPCRHIRKSHDEFKIKKSETFSDKYSPEGPDHGEPDLEYEDAEDAVPGRVLDRQLSRVGCPSSVSQGKHCAWQS